MRNPGWLLCGYAVAFRVSKERGQAPDGKTKKRKAYSTILDRRMYQ